MLELGFHCACAKSQYFLGFKLQLTGFSPQAFLSPELDFAGAAPRPLFNSSDQASKSSLEQKV